MYSHIHFFLIYMSQYHIYVIHCHGSFLLVLSLLYFVSVVFWFQLHIICCPSYLLSLMLSLPFVIPIICCLYCPLFVIFSNTWGCYGFCLNHVLSLLFVIPNFLGLLVHSPYFVVFVVCCPFYHYLFSLLLVVLTTYLGTCYTLLHHSSEIVVIQYQILSGKHFLP